MYQDELWDETTEEYNPAGLNQFDVMDEDWHPFKEQERIEKMYEESLFLNHENHRTSDGSVMKITSMTDRHLINMIKLLKREIQQSDNKYQIQLLKRKLAVYAIEFVNRQF
jgi:hypothetical protein